MNTNSALRLFNDLPILTITFYECDLDSHLQKQQRTNDIHLTMKQQHNRKGKENLFERIYDSMS